MNKIPIGQTIAFGYGFLVSEFRTVLRICWLPSLLIAGADYLTRHYSVFYVGETENFTTIATNYIVLAAGLFVILLSSSVMVAGIVRHSMRMPVAQENFYFPLGSAERRMFRALTLYVLAILFILSFLSILSALLFTLAGVDMGQPAGAQTPGAAALMASLVLLLMFIAAVVVIIRSGFLLAPVVVAEGKGLARSFHLSNGNFWRILAVLVLAVLPLAFGVGFLQLALITAVAGQEVLADTDQNLQALVENVAAAQPFLWAVLNFVSTVLATGLIYPIAAFAYGTLAKKGSINLTPPPNA